MAEEENGETNTTDLKDVFSINKETQNLEVFELNSSIPTNAHLVEDEHVPSGKCQMEQWLATAQCNEETLKAVHEDSTAQTVDSIPASYIAEVPQEGNVLSQSYAQNEVADVVPDIKETSSSASIEAISLVDIKTSLVNDELIDCDTDKSETNIFHVHNSSIPVTETQFVVESGLNDAPNTELPNLCSTVWQKLNQDSSKTHSDQSDIIVTETNPNQRVISSYAIQPGELTNQLVEGPSITLPPSEIPNRVPSLSSTSCSPLSIGQQTTANEFISKESSDLPSPASSSSGAVDSEPLPRSSNGILSSASESENKSTSSVSESGTGCSLALSAEQPTSTTTNELDSNDSSNLPSTSSPRADPEPLRRSSNGTPIYTLENKSTSSLSESISTTKTLVSTTDASLSSSVTPVPAPAKRVKKTPHDFIFGKVLGEGSFSTVYLAKEVSTQREFAVKVCEKKHLIREHKTHFVMREKEVLMKLDHPFFIRLAYTFQDTERLYYVLTYARNGELLTYLNKLSSFDVPCTRFYSAEVVIALEYLQSLGIIHRDMKPENILLGDDMHIKITDFGTSKIVNGATEVSEERKGRQSKRKNSFVGTAEYVSPEVLNGLPANYGTDLWALGCIVYQCLSSSLPFRSGNEYQTFQKILKLDYEFPMGFHEGAKDLVQRLLVIEPTERLGMKQPEGMQELKQHPFYVGIDWDNLPNTTPPKLLPYLPATADNPEFWGGQEQRTGFDDQRLAEIITGQSSDQSLLPKLEPVQAKRETQMEESERRDKIEKQRQQNQFHQFVENNLIFRQGFVDKRKGLFARKRMLLLTEGPHLYYVDAHNKVLKGEIPWSKELRVEAKNFKIFFVHTPNRTYYLESRNPDAHHWVKRIQEVWNKYYGDDKDL